MSVTNIKKLSELASTALAAYAHLLDEKNTQATNRGV